MSCLLTSGYPVPCFSNIAGVQAIYLGAYNYASPMTFVLGTSSNIGSITSFTGVTTSFYTFANPLETADFNQAYSINVQNGTTFYTSTIDFTLVQMNNVTNAIVNTIGQGIFRAIVLDQNGIYWYVGAQNGLRPSAITPGVGKASGDLNGAIVTLTGMEPIASYPVLTSAALALIAP